MDNKTGTLRRHRMGNAVIWRYLERKDQSLMGHQIKKNMLWKSLGRKWNKEDSRMMNKTGTLREDRTGNAVTWRYLERDDQSFRGRRRKKKFLGKNLGKR